MYRYANVRLPCEACAVERPTNAMALSPSGSGYLCWRCQLGAQIAEHERAPRRSRGRDLTTLHILGIAFACVGAFVLLYWLVIMFLVFGRIC